jgi:hypothetical protein
VFGKKLNKVETTYWKNRAIGKGEKYTVINLKKEMLSLKKQGRTMPKAVIKAKILKVNVAKK